MYSRRRENWHAFIQSSLHNLISCIPRESNPWPQRCERRDLLFEERLPSVDLRRCLWVRDVKYQRRPSSRWPADEQGQILIGHFTVCRFKEAGGWNDGSLSLHLRSVASSRLFRPHSRSALKSDWSEDGRKIDWKEETDRVKWDPAEIRSSTSGAWVITMETGPFPCALWGALCPWRPTVVSQHNNMSTEWEIMAVFTYFWAELLVSRKPLS